MLVSVLIQKGFQKLGKTSKVLHKSKSSISSKEVWALINNLDFTFSEVREVNNFM